MDHISPLHTWRAVLRAEVSRFRSEGFSTASIKTSSAYRQFIIELHSHWCAEHAKRQWTRRDLGPVANSRRNAYEDIPPEIGQETGSYRRQYRYQKSLNSAHGFHGDRKERYDGYLFELHLEARRLIFCEKCAVQKRASPNCEVCKKVRLNSSRQMLCPSCYEGRGVLSACKGIGACQQKCERLLFRSSMPPPCGCPWEAF